MLWRGLFVVQGLDRGEEEERRAKFDSRIDSRFVFSGNDYQINNLIINYQLLILVPFGA